jgi:2-dehydropantoate 2-reductase
MKVCIFGVGAVGGFMAAQMLQVKDTKLQVSVIARGEQLRAIAARGLILRKPDGDITARPHAHTDRAADLAPQDIVFVTLKAPSQPGVAKEIASLLAPGGHAVFVNNGIPWWWTYGTSDSASLSLLDPNANLWNLISPQRTLGCVVYSANEVIEPGVVRHAGNNRWLLGEPGGGLSDRLHQTVALLKEAGLGAEAIPDLRSQIWAKLLRNAPLNPLCALTRLPVEALASDPALLRQCDALINDIAAIALAQGCDLSTEIQGARDAIRGGAGKTGSAVGSVRPSMLQDVEAGRGMEVEAILGQAQAFARQRNTPCPAIDHILPLIRGLDRSLRAGS